MKIQVTIELDTERDNEATTFAKLSGAVEEIRALMEYSKPEPKPKRKRSYRKKAKEKQNDN